ncbi:MAG: C4-dicarboxylate transporter DctM subunit [Myxococcota bacterium]
MNDAAFNMLAMASDTGSGGWLLVALATVTLVLLGAPLFVIIGGFVFSSLAMFPLQSSFVANFDRTEQMVGMADQEALLAIPFFMVAGAIMGRGSIAPRLVELATSIFGWLPGGLAVAAIFACAFFAAISGSSPVTVVTIGAVMVPALKVAGYSDKLSHGVVTAAGGLGIIIPPSIPMVVYAVYAGFADESVNIRIEDIFLAGIIPGAIIAFMLSVYCMWSCRGMPRIPFSMKRVGNAILDGAWAIFLPFFILGGLYSGIFDAISAAAMSVVLAVVIEVAIHRSMKLSDVPEIISDMSVLMGALLIIIMVALGFEHFVDTHGIAEELGHWVASMDLTPLTFVLVLNVLLLLVGCLLDIISALVLFVPLLVPIALQMGIDPLHLGIIFIVNLEIGYLTPPLGINLFVATTFFQKPFGFVVKSVAPFLLMMLISLAVITYVPTASLAVRQLQNGDSIWVSFPSERPKAAITAIDDDEDAFDTELAATGDREALIVAACKDLDLDITDPDQRSIAEGLVDDQIREARIEAIAKELDLDTTDPDQLEIVESTLADRVEAEASEANKGRLEKAAKDLDLDLSDPDQLEIVEEFLKNQDAE